MTHYIQQQIRTERHFYHGTSRGGGVQRPSNKDAAPTKDCHRIFHADSCRAVNGVERLVNLHLPAMPKILCGRERVFSRGSSAVWPDDQDAALAAARSNAHLLLLI